MAKLVSMTKVLKRVFLEKLTVPSLQKNDNVIDSHQVAKNVTTHLNAMQRKGFMQGDNACWAFQQYSIGAVPAFYNSSRVATVWTFILVQKIAKTVMS
jgi:hypothetical protein